MTSKPMERKQAFLRVMGESINMALATSVDSRPNVRVVTFGYDETQPGRLFFYTFPGSGKTKEFAQSPHAACMPLPMGPAADQQVRIFGEAYPSSLPIGELIALIGRKVKNGVDMPDADMPEVGLEMMEVWEVRFTEAWVTLGMTEAQKYELD